jgi:hypothetical protein
VVNIKGYRNNQTFILIIALLIISIVVYLLEIIIFHNSHETFFLIFQDVAFLPVEVILITFILERFLSRREKQEKFKKIQVVIGAFYTDVGVSLIQNLARFNTNFSQLKKELDFENDSLLEKEKLLHFVRNFNYIVDSQAGDLEELRYFLQTIKSYILHMFENPNIIEHDHFTDMLWAVYHVLSELELRGTCIALPENDMQHLSADIKRAYQLTIREWAGYMIHIRKEYPYLFSLAIRKNPFAENEIIFE